MPWTARGQPDPYLVAQPLLEFRTGLQRPGPPAGPGGQSRRRPASARRPRPPGPPGRPPRHPGSRGTRPSPLPSRPWPGARPPTPPRSPTGSAWSGTSPFAQLSRSASVCLQGNFREGHEHLYDGPDSSTMTWYGFLPEPAHSPHTRSGDAPVPLHDAGRASPRAVLRDDSSAASASTASAPQRVDITGTLPAPTDISAPTRGHPGPPGATRGRRGRLRASPVRRVRERR